MGSNKNSGISIGRKGLNPFNIVVILVLTSIVILSVTVYIIPIDENLGFPNVSSKPRGYCGDGKCASSETTQACPLDCSCGDAICDASETNSICPIDCPPVIETIYTIISSVITSSTTSTTNTSTATTTTTTTISTATNATNQTTSTSSTTSTTALPNQTTTTTILQTTSTVPNQTTTTTTTAIPLNVSTSTSTSTTTSTAITTTTTVPNQTTTTTTTITFRCTDSDGGSNDLVYGCCQDNTGTFCDSCDGGMISEYYCQPLVNPTECNYTQRSCPHFYGSTYTCSAGKCTEITSTTIVPCGTLCAADCGADSVCIGKSKLSNKFACDENKNQVFITPAYGYCLCDVNCKVQFLQDVYGCQDGYSLDNCLNQCGADLVCHGLIQTMLPQTYCCFADKSRDYYTPCDYYCVCDPNCNSVYQQNYYGCSNGASGGVCIIQCGAHVKCMGRGPGSVYRCDASGNFNSGGSYFCTCTSNCQLVIE